MVRGILEIALAICTVVLQWDSVIATVVNVTDYVYWKKEDISMYHKFFPIRFLTEEQLTMKAALLAFNEMTVSINASLSQVVAFQTQELVTAKLLMTGTAQGCVNGISDIIPKAIDDGVESYFGCAYDAHSKIALLNDSWVKNHREYETAFQNAIRGIDACQKNYPNKNSIPRLKSCIESMYKNYHTAANKTKRVMHHSPSMVYFKETMFKCARDAAEKVSHKGKEFLKMLVECSKLSTLNPQTYEEELNRWKGYTDTLQEQIKVSQAKIHNQETAVEQEMIKYYRLQKNDLEKYVVESRGIDHYHNWTHLLLSEHYNTVTTTELDNPGNKGCTDEATKELDIAASNGASESLSCDVRIVNHTKGLIEKIKENFLYLNSLMTKDGNAALVNCFSQGYIFAPNTIAECFELVHAQFNLEHKDRLDAIKADVTVLKQYASTFVSGTDLPCGGTSLKKLQHKGNVVLDHLRRCLYKSTGYTKDHHSDVTTAVPETTEPTYRPNRPETPEFQWDENPDPYSREKEIPYNPTESPFSTHSPKIIELPWDIKESELI